MASAMDLAPQLPSKAIIIPVLAMLLSCGAPKPPCGPSTCSGCCVDEVTCETGASPTACGAGGQQCSACGANQSCTMGVCQGSGAGGGGGTGADGGAGGGAGATDSGTDDAGAADSGTADAGTADAGTADAGTPDAGPPCKQNQATCAVSAECCSSFCGASGTCEQPLQPGDTCALATPISLAAQGPTVVSGTTVGFRDDAQPTCAPASGPDRVYTFTTTTTLDLAVEVSTTSSTFRPVVALSGSVCAAERTCNAAPSAGGTARVTATQAPPGTYHVVIDGSGGGDFSLSISATAPVLPGEDCATAESLSFSNDLAVALGSTDGYRGDLSLAGCLGISGADRVYEFTLGSARTVQATVLGAGSFKPVVALLGPTTAGACATGSLLACFGPTNAQAPSSTTPQTLQPGTYFVVVSGGGYTGDFILTVQRLDTAMLGESCSAPAPLLSTSVTSTTSGRQNDTGGITCSAPGPDVVYWFPVAVPSSFSAATFEFTPGGAGGRVLRLTGPSSSCALAPEQACGSAGPVGAMLMAPRLEPGIHYLWVDGAAAGDFTLNAGTQPLPSSGETCSTPIDLTIFGPNQPGTVGSTSTATNDVIGSCGGTGPERVYRIRTTTTQTLTAHVQGIGLRPVMYLTTPGGCAAQPATSLDLGCVTASAPNVNTTLTVPSLPPGTYLLVVDSTAGQTGDFSLFVTLQ